VVSKGHSKKVQRMEEWLGPGGRELLGGEAFDLGGGPTGREDLIKKGEGRRVRKKGGMTNADG